MLPTAIVPVRVAPLTKRRLAHVVPGAQRAALVLELFDRVARELLRAGLRVVALTPQDIEVPAGVERWTDEGRGLNASLHAAVERAGFPALIVHADLPTVTAEDVRDLLDVDGDVVIARARDGGTNALLLRSRLRPAFGPRSSLVHAQRARAAGLRAVVIDHPQLALDVDDAAALSASAWRPTSRTTSPSRPTSRPTSSFLRPTP